MQSSADQRLKMLEKALRKSGFEKSALIEALHSAQEIYGYLENDTLKYIAKSLKLPPSKVLGVATFYHYFRMKPKGKHTCVVCTGTACYIKGADKLISAISNRFNIKVGETTKDNEISLLTSRCFGACAMAPAVVVDGKTVGYLDGAKIVSEIERIKDDNINN